ncbi:hypothetical protein ACF1A5_09410 [Streptomyces sp. NPDC014864]|uniref:hypothetical protein n=1 Tax=Streptomyces sp. NPDC014864 TaxID=3364924 RepID=UPI0036FABE26
MLEDTHTLTGPRKSGPSLPVRRILVHSIANALGITGNESGIQALTWHFDQACSTPKPPSTAGTHC